MGQMLNGHRPYPYEEMSEKLEYLNLGVPRAARWTVAGKNPSPRILAMDKNSDPFYAGIGWQQEAGEWFAEFHRRRVGERRLHIRALFYIATGEDPSPLTGEVEATYLPDGSRFEKTADNWQWFQAAAKHARNMELVDARLILDKRRSKVTQNARALERDAPTRAKAEAQNMVSEELERQMRWPHRALELIAERSEEVGAQFEEERAEIERKEQELEEMRDELDAKLSDELASLEERAEGVLQAARRRLERLEELELPQAEAKEPEGAAEGWLFDSRRDYFEQLSYYKHHKFGLPVEG